jgi:hypothetical protein
MGAQSKLGISLAFLIFFLLTSLDSHAETGAQSAVLRLKAIPVQKNDCTKLQTEFSSIIEKKDKDAFVPAKKVQFALNRIKDLDILSTDISHLVIDAMAEDPENGYRELGRLAHGECVYAVYHLFKALIATACDKDTPIPDRKGVDLSLRDWLRQKRIPTLLTASLDLALVEFAMEKRLWTSSTSQKQVVADQRSQLKLAIADVNKVLYGTEDPNTDKQPPSNLADFKVAQPSLIKEVKAAASQNEKLKTFVNDIR